MKSEKRSVFVEFRVANALHDRQIIFNLFKTLCVRTHFMIEGSLFKSPRCHKIPSGQTTFFMNGPKHNKA